jgi:hypothetical protein
VLEDQPGGVGAVLADEATLRPAAGGDHVHKPRAVVVDDAEHLPNGSWRRGAGLPLEQQVGHGVSETLAWSDASHAAR